MVFAARIVSVSHDDDDDDDGDEDDDDDDNDDDDGDDDDDDDDDDDWVWKPSHTINACAYSNHAKFQTKPTHIYIKTTLAPCSALINL